MVQQNWSWPWLCDLLQTQQWIVGLCFGYFTGPCGAARVPWNDTVLVLSCVLIQSAEVCLYAGQILRTVPKPAGDEVSPRCGALFFTTGRRGRWVKKKRGVSAIAKSNVLVLWLMVCKWIYLAHFWFRSCKTTRASWSQGNRWHGDTHSLDYFCSDSVPCQGCSDKRACPRLPSYPCFLLLDTGTNGDMDREQLLMNTAALIMMPARPSDCVKDCVPVGRAPSAGELAPDPAVPRESTLRLGWGRSRCLWTFSYIFFFFLHCLAQRPTVK